MPAAIVTDDTVTYLDGTTVQTTRFDDGTSTVRTIPGPGTPESNRQSIVVKLALKIDNNDADRAADATIITQCDALIATTGDRTLTQLSGDVRSLAANQRKLAQADVASKKELTALIRLAANALTSTSGT